MKRATQQRASLELAAADGNPLALMVLRREATNARQAAELRRLRKAIRNAKKQVTPLVDWEIGEGTRGEMSDPLRGVLKILAAALKPARRKP